MNKPIKTLYLAGPMRGIRLYNFPEFDRVAKLLRDAGYKAISPADLDREFGFDPSRGDVATPGFLQDAMQRDIKAIIYDADAVALLDGWKNSKGARAECAIADWCGKMALPYADWLEGALVDKVEQKHRPAEPIPQEAEEFVSGFTMPKELYVPGEGARIQDGLIGAALGGQAERPKFAEWSIPVLQESIDLLNERGAQYGDTYKTCQFLHFKAVAKLLGVALPASPEITRALSLAALSDIKYERQGGAYKSDNVKDGINYLAAMDGAVQEALKTIKKTNEHTNANK